MYQLRQNQVDDRYYLQMKRVKIYSVVIVTPGEKMSKKKTLESYMTKMGTCPQAGMVHVDSFTTLPAPRYCFQPQAR